MIFIKTKEWNTIPERIRRCKLYIVTTVYRCINRSYKFLYNSKFKDRHSRFMSEYYFIMCKVIYKQTKMTIIDNYKNMNWCKKYAFKELNKPDSDYNEYYKWFKAYCYYKKTMEMFMETYYMCKDKLKEQGVTFI